MKNLEKDIQRASTANEEELEPLVHHSSLRVIARLIYNKNLTEDLALILAGRKNISPDILEALSINARWKNSYKIKLALCKNPKTPRGSPLRL